MSHGAADAVPEVATRMAAVNKTAPARSRVFLVCPGRSRVFMFSPIDVQGCERSQYLLASLGAALAEATRFHSCQGARFDVIAIERHNQRMRGKRGRAGREAGGGS